ncbi:MAG: hypothetical protein H0V88_12670 [Pyrinomonadaceae bacterium]|nr:hypothetical protein [Pyrinomonadaceae bacterium]
MLTSYGFRRLAIQNSKLQFVVWTLSSLYALAVSLNPYRSMINWNLLIIDETRGIQADT